MCIVESAQMWAGLAYYSVNTTRKSRRTYYRSYDDVQMSVWAVHENCLYSWSYIKTQVRCVLRW